jgi:hypothetical protein
LLKLNSFSEKEEKKRGFKKEKPFKKTETEYEVHSNDTLGDGANWVEEGAVLLRFTGLKISNVNQRVKVGTDIVQSESKKFFRLEADQYQQLLQASKSTGVVLNINEDRFVDVFT